MNDSFAQTEANRNPDYSALFAIFDEYAPLIYNYVGGFCHAPEQTESITGDVLAQFLEKTSLWKRPPSDAPISLYRMAYDTMVKHLGAGGQQPPAFIASLPSQEQEQGLIKAHRASWKEELR